METIISQNDICSRRDFLEKTAKGIGAVALGSFVVTFINACSSDSNPTEPSDNSGGGTLTVDISLPANQTLANIGGTLALDSNAVDSKGLLLYRESETVVRAYSRECTHQQCTIGGFNASGVSTCPCHGSQFNINGNVSRGPAGSPLKKYTAALDGNIITIS